MVVIVFDKPNVKRRRVVQPKDPSCRYIPLTKGQKAIVDAEEYDWLMTWNWCAKWDEGTGSYYARRKVRPFEGLGTSMVGMHNVIMGAWGKLVDHRNGDTLDMRKQNLRVATYQQNTFNHPTRKDNRLGVKGIRETKYGRFETRICVDGVRKSVTCATLDEAIALRSVRAAELHGEFRRVA